MAETHYCWRCETEVGMLNEKEWANIEPLLHEGIRDIKDYRRKTHAELSEALAQNQGLPALQTYKDITGFVETNINAIWHHRRKNFGDPCQECGKLLRTPVAKFCPECGCPKKFRLTSRLIRTLLQ